MIYFPSTLTPVPNCQGYFWDVVEHKLYSIKQGGELREMKKRRLWSGVAHKFARQHSGDLCYTISRNGRRRTLFHEDLKRLELVHYDFPVVKRMETADAD